MKLIARIDLQKLLDAEQFTIYNKAFGDLATAERMVVEAFYKSAEGSLIHKSGQTPPEIVINGHTLTVTYKPLYNAVQLDVTEITDYDRFGSLTSRMPETVLNTLLHGKLLSDEEKRALLVSQGYLTEKKNEPS